MIAKLKKMRRTANFGLYGSIAVVLLTVILHFSPFHITYQQPQVSRSMLIAGTILAVSHDRYFINRFATKVAVLTEDGVREYPGNFDDYQARLKWEQSQQDFDPRFAEMTRTEAGKEKRKLREAREQLKQLKENVKNAEKAVGDAEAAVAAHEQLMAAPETYAVPEKAAAAAREYQRLKDALGAAYAAWEAAEEALADAEN